MCVMPSASAAQELLNITEEVELMTSRMLFPVAFRPVDFGIILRPKLPG